MAELKGGSQEERMTRMEDKWERLEVLLRIWLEGNEEGADPILWPERRQNAKMAPNVPASADHRFPG